MNIWLLQTRELLPIQNGVRKIHTALLADTLLERDFSVIGRQAPLSIKEKDGYQREIRIYMLIQISPFAYSMGPATIRNLFCPLPQPSHRCLEIPGAIKEREQTGYHCHLDTMLSSGLRGHASLLPILWF
jgi:hypothetical protein